MFINPFFEQASPITIQLPADAPAWLIAFTVLAIVLITITIAFFRLKTKEKESETSENNTDVTGTISLAQTVRELVEITIRDLATSNREAAENMKQAGANIDKAAQITISTNETVQKLIQVYEPRVRTLEELSSKLFELNQSTKVELADMRVKLSAQIDDSHSKITREFSPLREAIDKWLTEFQQTREAISQLNCEQLSQTILNAMEQRNYTVLPKKLGVVLLNPAGKELWRNEEAGDFNVLSEEVQKYIADRVEQKGLPISTHFVNIEFLPDNLVLLLVI